MLGTRVRGHARAFPGRDMSRPQSGVMPPHSKPILFSVNRCALCGEYSSPFAHFAHFAACLLGLSVPPGSHSCDSLYS